MSSARFEQNLAALQGRYPQLVQRVRAHRPSPSYRLVSTPSGLPDVALDRDGETALYSGAANPLEEARAYWRTRELRFPALMVFLGLDLGYRLFAYLERPNPNTEAYILVERDLDAFYHLLHVADLSTVVNNPHCHLVVGEPEEGLFLTLRGILDQGFLYSLAFATTIEGSSAGYRLDPAYYKAFLVKLRDALHDLVLLAGNAPQDSYNGVRSMLLNLETIAREPGIQGVFGRFQGRPAIIVATGPSLDKNCHELVEAQDRAVILSVDASFKALLRRGIRPHFVTCIERVPLCVPFFDGIPEEDARLTVQVALPVVLPEVYSVYPGPKALMYNRYAHFEWLENEKGTLSVGPSCANQAFKLAVAMGCDPIILVGQDLAYGDDGATHSSAAPWGKSFDDITAERVGAFPVKGNLKEWVLTNKPWNAFRLYYVRDCAAFPGTVINATEGGAYIDGTEVLPLREALDRHCGARFHARSTIRSALARPGEDEAERYLAWVRDVRIPETLALLEAEIDRIEALQTSIAPALAATADSVRAAQAIRACREFQRSLFSPGFFNQVAGMVVQPDFVRLMLEHNDVPNRLSHERDINQERLRLHAKFLTDAKTMLRRLHDLYRDPHSVPLQA